MAKEKLISVEIGGYPRVIQERRLLEFLKEAEKMKQKCLELGLTEEEAEEMYSVKIVKDR